MLKIILMTSSLLPLSLMNPNKSWIYISSLMMLLSLYSLKIMYLPNLTSLNESIFMANNMSASLASLSIWISSLMILASVKIKKTKNSPKSFVFIIIMLLIILLMAFYANNMIMFYMMFESSLIPVLFLILAWGYQPERLQASMYLMMYTIFASLPLLISILMWNKTMGHTSFLTTWTHPLLPNYLLSLWWLMSSAAFLVKLPMFLTHLWLPKAHVEAPVAGSMVLAAILLKLGGFGLLQMTLLMKININMNTALISSISLCGAVITSIICLRQTDLKALIAYSSVGHMGLLIAGTLSLSHTGNTGSMLMMIAHGLSSSALFTLSNMTYETTNTRSLYLTKGASLILPYMTLWWFLLAAANMAAPPSINLLSEILLIMSIISFSKYSWILLSLASFLSAAYSLYLYTSSQHGPTPTFISAIQSAMSMNSTTLLFHFIPIITLIMKPEMVMLA